MKKLRQAWPLLALVGVAALLFRRPKGQRNPGGLATADELAYTDYLTAGDGSPRLDFSAWAAVGKPRS